MFELFRAGGWLMWPILACSVLSVAIIFDRLWTLRQSKVAPKSLVPQIFQWVRRNQLDNTHLQTLSKGSPLGRILCAGLVNRKHSKEVMKESIEEIGRHVVLDLERFLNTLGTIASVTPLLGLLGTVIGMIKVFNAITVHGVGDPTILAGGISEALLTTAAGLSVAIPSVMFHRYFRGKVHQLVVTMERESLKLVEVLHGDREMGPEE